MVSNLKMGFSYLKTFFEYNFKNQNWFDHSENRIRKNIHNCFFHFSKWLFSQSSLCAVVASGECCRLTDSLAEMTTEEPRTCDNIFHTPLKFTKSRWTINTKNPLERGMFIFWCLSGCK